MRFLEALRRRPVDRTPVWFMRQAGRYMPQYRALRERYSLLDICRTPELAAQVTLQPVEQLAVDAAIIFADLLLPLEGLGVAFEFPDGGPRIEEPLTSAAQIAALPASPDLPQPTLESIRLVKPSLGVPLIGFAGAPFTLASYLIEGGPSRHYLRTKGLMWSQPAVWHDLLDRLARLALRFLLAQAEAGADAVQVFDSWAGALGAEDYRSYVLPHSRTIFDGLRQAGVPSIHFATGTAGWLDLQAEAGGDAIGVDWRVPLRAAWHQIGDGRAIQGNLDPAALFAPLPELERRVHAVLGQAGGRTGHIFSLGHGILPGTPVEHVRAVVRMVREYRS